jgi:hypothetical protein
MPPRIKHQTKPVSVNISSVTMNKENNAKTRVRNDSRGPVETKRTVIPSGEEIEGQDIDQKLNRLQDLLRMAKGSV